jgi:hypothetical protein
VATFRGPVGAVSPKKTMEVESRFFEKTMEVENHIFDKMMEVEGL